MGVIHTKECKASPPLTKCRIFSYTHDAELMGRYNKTKLVNFYCSDSLTLHHGAVIKQNGASEVDKFQGFKISRIHHILRL